MRARRASARAGLFAACALLLAPPAPAQVCTPDYCEIPAAESGAAEAGSVAAMAHGYMGAAEFAGFLENGAFGGGVAPEPSGRGFLWRLAAAFLAGLLLNLSPCVLPLIPIQLAVLGIGATAGSRARGALRGAVYGGAMALAYGVAGLVIVRGGGVFGSLQSTRPFNIAMGALFVVLAMAMAGVFSIDFSSRRRRVSRPLPLAGLAAAGAAAAAMAGACVAPAVLGTFLYASGAYAAGDVHAVLLPLALGLGMALPWPAIGAGLAFMPRPGRWMAGVKWLFALVALALAARYFMLAAPRVGAKGGAIDYRDFQAAYDDARASGKPVVVDFFASWCSSCLRMEKTTFRDGRVAELLGKCEFLRVQVEDPLEPDATALLARFGVRGFPAIVILKPAAGR